VTKYIAGRFTQTQRGTVLGFLFGAIAMAGCDSGDTGAGKAPQGGAPAPVAAPSSTKDSAGKTKGDTTSRREHQKERAGTTK